MKQCSICGEIKDESEFHIRHRNKDGSVNLRSECKSCHSDGEMERYYQKQAFVDGKKTPCVKCGENRIRCISFHHKNPSEKEFTIGQLLKSNFKVIEKEINKCICLCLNCHHEFHYLNNAIGTTLDDYLADSYNGSTSVFDTDSDGSEPSSAARGKVAPCYVSESRTPHKK